MPTWNQTISVRGYYLLLTTYSLLLTTYYLLLSPNLEPDDQREGALMDVPHAGGAHADGGEVDEALGAGGLDARAVPPHRRRVAQHSHE